MRPQSVANLLRFAPRWLPRAPMQDTSGHTQHMPLGGDWRAVPFLALTSPVPFQRLGRASASAHGPSPSGTQAEPMYVCFGVVRPRASVLLHRIFRRIHTRCLASLRKREPRLCARCCLSTVREAICVTFCQAPSRASALSVAIDHIDSQVVHVCEPLHDHRTGPTMHS